MDERLERNVVIARSGVYFYDASELERMTQLSRREMPSEYVGLESFGVYTPATVLIEAKDKFTKLPLTREHPPVAINPDNFKEYAIGWSGDAASIIPIMESKEIGVESTCVLIDREALVYYECNVRDVSPGYFARYRWEAGVSPDGQEYQIVKYAIDEANHLAFTRMGRGGPEISMDSIPARNYYDMRMTMDSSEPTFRMMMDDIIENRGEYDDDELAMGIGTILALVDAMPDCDEKAILTRVIKEFYRVKDFTGDAKNAAEYVTKLFEDTDKKIMEDSTVLFKKKPTTDAAPPEEEKPYEAPAAPVETEPEAPADVPGEPDAAEAESVGEAPVGPEAAPAETVAPIAQVAMEVEQMPDDVSTLSDDELRAFLNGVVKFLKSIAPGEAVEPEHQAPVTDSADEPEVPVVDGEEEDEENGPTMDSIFSVKMGNGNKPTPDLDALSKSLFGKKGAK